MFLFSIQALWKDIFLVGSGRVRFEALSQTKGVPVLLYTATSGIRIMIKYTTLFQNKAFVQMLMIHGWTKSSIEATS